MKITLDCITCEDFKIRTKFSYDSELSAFFNENEMIYDYAIDDMQVDLSSVPESILVIPWLCNILPIAWLTDSTIEIDCIDKDFYESIDEFKQGYIDMHSECDFLGKLIVNKIVSNECKVSQKSAMFFSAGADAYCTLVRHIKEKPDLITIWGADIPYDNKEGWLVLKKGISKSASELGLPLITVHTSFRKMLNEHNLTKKFHSKLHDGWWHAAQHGIGLIGHAAPINYYRNVSTQYIAASYWPGVNISCASWPTIDNKVKFFGCKVFHDAFIPRQEKISAIVKSHVYENTPINMHVCWKNTSGNNCCICEKCCRTIMGLYSEAANPKEYGFDIPENIEHQINLCRNVFEYDFISIPMWNQIKQRAIENRDKISEAGYLDKIQWMYNFDFDGASKTLGRRIRRLKKRIIDKIDNTFCR